MNSGEKDSIQNLKEEIYLLQNEILNLKRRAQEIVNICRDIIIILDRQLKITLVNSAAEKFFGKPSHEIIGGKIADFLSPDIADYHSKMFQKVFDTGETISHTPPFLLPPLNLWIETNLYPLKEKDGSITHVFALVRDVTESKLIESALKESELTYRQIIQQMTFPVLICSNDGTILVANFLFLELFKIKSDEDIIGKVNILRNPIITELKINAELLKAFNGENVLIPEVYVPAKLINKEKINEYCIFELTAYPVFVRPGEICRVVIILKDITEQKKAELELIEKNKRIKTQFKSFPIPTYIWQKRENTFVFIDYNDAAYNITDGNVEKTIGFTLEEMYGDNQEIIEDMYNCFYKKIIIRREIKLEYKITKKQKDLFVTYVFVEPDLVMVHTEDITEKRKLEEEIRKSEHFESLSILAAGIAHDFNNFLAGIFGYIGLARELGKNNIELRDSLDKAMVVFGHAKALTQQLLTFSKGGVPSKKLTSVSDLLKDLSSFVLSGSNVKANLKIPLDLWPSEIDSGQLSQAISNILINAQQSMPEGGYIDIIAENFILSNPKELPIKSGNYVRIIIKDYGIGIPKNHLNKIFDPFFTTKQKGSGLGLTIAYSIVKKHDGYIQVESEQNKGTTVFIYLPASNKISNISHETKTQSKEVKNKKILVMDDEPFVLDSMCKILKSFGCIAIGVKNGKEAIEAYKKALNENQIFDAVILDLTIPGGFGGKQVLTELKKLNPNIKAIATSGYSDDPVIAQPDNFGFFSAISKPYIIEDLRSVIYKIIE